jgi:hypothetical protein
MLLVLLSMLRAASTQLRRTGFGDGNWIKWYIWGVLWVD